MAVIWLLFLLVTQAGWISPCVFDKVEMVNGTFCGVIGSEYECFDKCYENNNCIAFAFRKVENACYLYCEGNTPYPCLPGNICYSIQRDEVDLTCERYVEV